MRAGIVAILVIVGLVLAIRPQEKIDAKSPPAVAWSFDGVFGTYDLASAQRGFQVYNEVCATCHSMNLVHYRDLTGIGLPPDAIKAVATSKQVPGGVDDSGQPVERPGLPSDTFKAPYANVQAAAAANGGKAPPDQSLLVNAREDGPNYVHALMLGYPENPPEGVKVPDGLYYNEYYPGHLIHMPAPLHDGQVTYADGTKATVDQMAKDVTTFLMWTSNPEQVERKQIGVRMVIFLALMTVLVYVVKRQIWSRVDH